MELLKEHGDMFTVYGEFIKGFRSLVVHGELTGD